ncbi:MAG: hypothetical protein ACLP05_03995 [Candidatus Kryptoniota bacterium]
MSETYEVDSTVKSQTATVTELGLSGFSFEASKRFEAVSQSIWIIEPSTYIDPTIELLGIPFKVRHGEKYVFIESLRWPSLQTFGETTQEAIQNMRKLIKDVVEEFVLASDDELAEDAIEFKQYLIKKMIS